LESREAIGDQGRTLASSILKRGIQVRGAGTVLLFCVVKWYEMYEKFDVYNLPISCNFHVSRIFQKLPSDSSFSGLFWGSRDGTAWRQGSRR